MKPMKSNTEKSKRRRGVTMIELVVAAVVLVVVMSSVTTLCFRISLVWQDIGQHRVAVAELSNQLDRLTRMNLQQVRDELQSLTPSELAQRTLHEPQLSGEMLPTEIGHQINLQLDWKRVNPGQPVELTGWIPNDPKPEEGSR